MPTFKDNDFTKDNVKIVVGDEAKAALVEKVKDDVEVRHTTGYCKFSTHIRYNLPFVQR